MRILLLAGLLGLSSCDGQPKFEQPVLVLANDTPVRSAPETSAAVLVLADKGDTLEYERGQIGVAGADFVAVTPDAHYSRFKSGEKYGYLLRSQVKIFPRRPGKGNITPVPAAPRHLN